MKTMIIGASADWSTRDTEIGYTDAFAELGHDVVPYSLRNRLKAWTDFHSMLKEGIMCPECGTLAREPVDGFERVNEMTTAGAASESIPYIALMTGVELVVVISGGLLHPNAVVALRNAGIPVVTVLTESPYQDDDQSELVSVSTITTTNERTSVDKLRAVTNRYTGEPSRVHYGAPAYNPRVHHPYPRDPDKRCDVVLVGTGFGERSRLLAGVNWSGIDLRILGYWRDVPDALAPYVISGPIDNAETARWYASARIVLQTHRDADGAESIGPRVYEAAACGAFQLCDDRAELAEVFGVSVPSFKSGSTAGLETAIRHWLGFVDQKADTAPILDNLAAGARREVAAHTYAARVQSILERLREAQGEQ